MGDKSHNRRQQQIDDGREAAVESRASSQALLVILERLVVFRELGFEL